MSVPRIESILLGALAHVRHGFFTRQGGVSTGIYASLNTGLGSQDAPEHVAENRARCAATLGLESNQLVTLYQIHSAKAVTLSAPFSADERPEADGMASKARGLGLGVLAADCGPVLFADAREPVIGAAHAGWKGALGGVLEATIAAMEAQGAARERIVAALGPCISATAYEVGPEFEARFAAADKEAARFFARAPRQDHFLFNLPGYIGNRLARAGINKIDLGARCTYDNPALYFSYRRATHLGEPDYGRNLSAIALA
jgi:YfiH family protein